MSGNLHKNLSIIDCC